MAGIMIAMAALMKVLIAALFKMVAGAPGVPGMRAAQVPAGQQEHRAVLRIAIILILLVVAVTVPALPERVALTH